MLICLSKAVSTQFCLAAEKTWFQSELIYRLEQKSVPMKADKSSPKRKATSPKKSSKFLFTLSDIDLDKIEQKYGLPGEPLPQNTTSLTDLASATIGGAKTHTITFIDEAKAEHPCTISMVDYTSGSTMGSANFCNCFWDRHPFSTPAIGCPIRYVPDKVIRNYFSEISRENRVIRGAVTSEESRRLVFKPEKETAKVAVSLEKGGYYEVDGIFCSTSCVKAYIRENKHNPIYAHSNSLLVKLVSDLTGVKGVVINEAPHWRQLRSYGGDKTIAEFRNSFNKVSYTCHGLYRESSPGKSAETSRFKPVGTLFEEKLNF